MDPYEKYEIHDRDSDMYFNEDYHYFITWGPHKGRVVNAEVGGVLTYPDGNVVLEPDVESFLKVFPWHREEE